MKWCIEVGQVTRDGRDDRTAVAEAGPPVAARRPLRGHAQTMNHFAAMHLPEHPTVTAPDGSDVRVLLRTGRGSMAHFELPAGKTSLAVTHRTVEEIWYVVAGCGEMWRRQGSTEEVVALEPGVCLTIPLGTHFQFRAMPDSAVAAVGVTMPPWPGEDEAVAVSGRWQPSVAR